MANLLDRNIIFKNYKKIAAEISEIQNAFYDEDYLQEFCKTKEEQDEYLKLFDAKDLKLPEVEKTYKKISFDYTDIKTFSKALTDNLKKLLEQIKVKKLVIIAHYKMPFVGNIDNKYPPLQKAVKRLKAITNDIKYDNAFETDVDTLFDLVDIAFWIERCDASGPEFIFFHDVEEKLSFNICKHGNVHIIEYGRNRLTKKLLKQNGWYLINDRCFDKFTKDGRIKGRRLKI